MNPSDGDWWWQYGLQGLVGSLIGGSITAVAVIATLRHERRMVDLQEARALSSRLLALANRIGRSLRDGRRITAEQDAELETLGVELAARTHHRWPEFSLRVDVAIEHLDTELGDLYLVPAERGVAAHELRSVVERWLLDPRSGQLPWRRRVRALLPRHLR